MNAPGGCVCGYRVVERPTYSFLDGAPGAVQAGDFHVCMGCGRPLILDAVEGWRVAHALELLRAPPATRAMLATVAKATHAAIRRSAGRGVGGMVN